jgi:transcriptional regulator with XRE-family HTH domain
LPYRLPRGSNEAMLTGPELGAAIEQARLKKGVTKKAFAEAMGVQPASVQDWIKYGRLAKVRINDLVAYFADVVPLSFWGLQFQDDGAQTSVPQKSLDLAIPDFTADATGVQKPFSRQMKLLINDLVAAERDGLLSVKTVNALREVLRAATPSQRKPVVRRTVNRTLAEGTEGRANEKGKTG